MHLMQMHRMQLSRLVHDPPVLVSSHYGLCHGAGIRFVTLAVDDPRRVGTYRGGLAARLLAERALRIAFDIWEVLRRGPEPG